ncbi:type VII secretion-associated serine protease mycosin [Mycobacterium alsense]|uniref:Type VII secretion-associated serine protease mycosin n=1 Tax=Mycobacterium alsense TaxID=324058 RepID=A0AA41XMA1_9MYCO|nr:type VII secretion-associated serine protease mycosin [Mycobacterium alsense]MCV7378395.1 type VII secretion-associated serine protease mycosin [Mycobacterium alsense]OQZ90128.1 type VII secretion-associated serine protease mycosin [Mycobacterium alsense]ORV83909.1 subtilase [Mycobacterium interjectum]
MMRPQAGLACVTAALAAMMWTAPSALAVDQPKVDPGVPPPSGTPGPGQPMEQRGPCSASGVIPGSDPAVTTPSQAMLNLPAAWRFSRGEGQLVGVIDTGVRPGPRLPNVDPGGDFVETTDGLTDCDGHGTLVAGVIAGQPGDDGFSGVAPAARVLSIRTTSAKFSPRTPGGDPLLARASQDVATLARAIVHAADLGARVINISAITCLPADRTVDQAALGAAIRYAAVDKDAVIVAAAGNNGPTGSVAGGTSCESNPLTDLGRPDDPRNWAGVTSVSIPSWWQPYVLSTASLTPDAEPSKFTMAGPWVGVAAPGENIVSVSNRDGGGLANGLPDEHQQLIALSGTSYAAGYVSGVAALVRSKYPQLTATQVVHRITATAHNGARAPSNVVGAGAVDPVAALTWELPAGNPSGGPAARPVAAPPTPAPESTTPRTVAFAGTAALAVVVAIVAAITAIVRKKETTP